MRECLYEKNVDFTADYRSQKHTITAQIVRSFKKKAPDFPITAADWAVKEMLVSTIQNKRKLLSEKKKNELENNLRVPPQNSPALQDRPPPSPQVQQDPPSPVEPSDEQVQVWPPEPRTDEQVQVRPPEPRTNEKFKVILQKGKRDKVNSLNETIENKDKEITQLKRQKTFAVELYQQKLNQIIEIENKLENNCKCIENE
ncbi:unnamed protein product [Rhizophagus irregularis]|nr:unnamed protein product [Rhizophagus irregularis]